jgi:hypothetical protein
VINEQLYGNYYNPSCDEYPVRFGNVYKCMSGGANITLELKQCVPCHHDGYVSDFPTQPGCSSPCFWDEGDVCLSDGEEQLMPAEVKDFTTVMGTTKWHPTYNSTTILRGRFEVTFEASNSLFLYNSTSVWLANNGTHRISTMTIPSGTKLTKLTVMKVVQGHTKPCNLPACPIAAGKIWSQSSIVDGSGSVSFNNSKGASVTIKVLSGAISANDDHAALAMVGNVLVDSSNLNRFDDLTCSPCCVIRGKHPNVDLMDFSHVPPMWWNHGCFKGTTDWSSYTLTQTPAWGEQEWLALPYVDSGVSLKCSDLSGNLRTNGYIGSVAASVRKFDYKSCSFTRVSGAKYMSPPSIAIVASNITVTNLIKTPNIVNLTCEDGVLIEGRGQLTVPVNYINTRDSGVVSLQVNGFEARVLAKNGMVEEIWSFSSPVTGSYELTLGSHKCSGSVRMLPVNSFDPKFVRFDVAGGTFEDKVWSPFNFGPISISPGTLAIGSGLSLLGAGVLGVGGIAGYMMLKRNNLVKKLA